MVYSHALPPASLELDFLLEPLSFAPATGAPQQVPAGARIHPEAHQVLHRRSRWGPVSRSRTQELLGGLVSAGPTLGSQLVYDSTWQSKAWHRHLSVQQRQSRKAFRSAKQQGKSAPANPLVPVQQQHLLEQARGVSTHTHQVLLPPPPPATAQPPALPTTLSLHKQHPTQPALEETSDLLGTGRGSGRRRGRAWRACCPAAARLCLGALRCVSGPLLPVAGFLVAAGVCAFAPGWPSILLGAAAIASRGRVAHVPLLPPWRFVHLLLSPLQPLYQPMLLISLMWATLPTCLPGVWRAICYWNRLLPICVRYFRTRQSARQLRTQGRLGKADTLWAEQHERGAHEMFLMLCDLKGFYMKLGQILATKTEMLPLPYTKSLSGLLDKLPAVPYDQVVQVLKRELHSSSLEEFAHIDPIPMATATIAQVHGGVLQGPSLRQVAIKVQHKGVKRMMRADLVNMKLAMDLLDLFHIDLGFDLGSIVREYHVYVPLECSFTREAEGMQLVRTALKAWAQDFPILKKVMVPRVYAHLSTDRVLVMTRVNGVPILDTAGMEPHIRRESMEALVMAFGVQILLEGIFHTDPHPGNLMAAPDPAGGGVRVAILDWGQMKQLTHNERVRYALLVVAMASRDGDLLRATLAELGVRIENCEDSFAEVAGYILFDTRMDMPEALESPMAKDANEGWRTTRVPKLPRDLFMIMRVITLLRGVLVSMGVHDVSSAIQWRPLAMQVLSELTHVPRSPPAYLPRASHENGSAPVSPRTPTCMSPSKFPPFSPASEGGKQKGLSHGGGRQQGVNTPEVLLAGRRFLAQQEVAVAHAQLSSAHAQLSPRSTPTKSSLWPSTATPIGTATRQLPAGPAHPTSPMHSELSPRNTPTKSSPSIAAANSTTSKQRHAPAGPANPTSPMQKELSQHKTPTKSSPSTAAANTTSNQRHLPAGSAHAASPTQNGKAAHTTAGAASAQEVWGSPVQSKAAGVAPYSPAQSKATGVAPFSGPPAYNLFPGTPMSSSSGPQHSRPGVAPLSVAVPRGQGKAEGSVDSMQIPCLEPASPPSGVLF